MTFTMGQLFQCPSGPWLEVAALYTEVDCNDLVLFGASEADSFREVAVDSDHHRQVPLQTHAL